MIMGEGDHYELSGGRPLRAVRREGMWKAAAAMRADGATYMPLACELSREGLYAPVIFIDPQTIVIRRFYYRLPDHGPHKLQPAGC